MKPRSVRLAAAFVGIVAPLWTAGNALADGAIVSSPDNRMLYIVTGGSPAESSKYALDQCETVYKAGCKVVETFGSGCFAFARAADGRLSYALSGMYAKVQEDALAKCAANGGKSCTIARANCQQSF